MTTVLAKPAPWRSNLLGCAVSVLVFAAAGGYLYFHRHDLQALDAIRASELMAIGAAVFAFFLATGATFYLFLLTVSIRLAPLEWIGLTFLTNFANYLLPTRPGAAIKALYLNKVSGLPFARFSAVLAAQGLTSFFTAGLSGLLLLAFFSGRPGAAPPALVATCLVTVAAAGVPFALRLRSPRSSSKLAAFVREAFDGFALIKEQRAALLAAAGSVLVQYLLSGVLYVLVYRALGSPIDFSVALLIGVFSSLSNSFTITPNNLGVQEVIIAYLYSLTGLDFAAGLLGAGLTRATHLALTFGVTPVLTVLLLRRKGLGLDTIWPLNRKE